MGMIIDVPDEIAHAAKLMAKDAGCLPEQLLIQALHAHFPPITDELKAEFDAWSAASDEDAAGLANGEGLG